MKKDKAFQQKIQKHLIKFKSESQYLPPKNRRKWLYHDIADNLYPPMRNGLLQYVYDQGMPLHDFVKHVRSSQAFCINLFFHLLKNEQNVLLDVLSTFSKIKLTKIADYCFEFTANENLLGEWKSDRNRQDKYVTSTDLYIKAIDEANMPIDFLIEVKFSENEFTNCGGYASKNNSAESMAACKNGKALLSDFHACYLHGANGKSKLKRKYLDYFQKEDFNEEMFSDKCPFINNHQCIRNQSLLRALEKDEKIKKGFFALVYHDQNDPIIEEWNKYTQVLSPKANSEILSIPVSEFIKRSKDDTYRKYFKDRYRID